jgi:hypothetical protein
MIASQQHPTCVASYIKTIKDVHQQTRDVSSPSPSMAMKVVREPGHHLKVQDPFLYYSNDQVRMKELQLQEEDSSNEASTSLSIQEQHTTTSVRKTRISFELHPSLLLEDFLLDDEHILDDSLNFEDIIDASLLADEQDSGA